MSEPILTNRQLKYFYDPNTDELALTQRIADFGYRYVFHNELPDGFADIYLSVNYHDPILENNKFTPVWIENPDQKLLELPTISLTINEEMLEHGLYYTFPMNVSDFPDACTYVALIGGVAIFASADPDLNTLRVGPIISSVSGMLTVRIVVSKNGYYPRIHEVQKRVYGDNFIPRIMFADTGLSVVNDSVLVGKVTAYDADMDAVLTFSAQNGQLGTVEVDNRGKYIYTPYASTVGDDYFNINVMDDRGGLAIANIHVIVTDRPNLDYIPDIEIIHDNFIDIAPVVFDRDSVESQITLTVDYTGTKGSVVLVNPNQATYPGRTMKVIRYTAKKGSSGLDSFTVYTEDQSGNVASQIVSVNIVNGPPELSMEDIVYTAFKPVNNTVALNESGVKSYSFDFANSDEEDLQQVFFLDGDNNRRTYMTIGPEYLAWRLATQVTASTAKFNITNAVNPAILADLSRYYFKSHLSGFASVIAAASPKFVDSATVAATNYPIVYTQGLYLRDITAGSVDVTSKYTSSNVIVDEYVETITLRGDPETYMQINDVFISGVNRINNILEGAAYVARLMSLRRSTIIIEGIAEGATDYSQIGEYMFTEQEWLQGTNAILFNNNFVVFQKPAQNPGKYKNVRIRMPAAYIGYYADKTEAEKRAGVLSGYGNNIGVYFGGSYDYSQLLPTTDIRFVAVDNTGNERTEQFTLTFDLGV